MAQWILQSEQVRAETCGGKAYRLLQMHRAGLSVPPFLCIPQEVMTQCFVPGGETQPLPAALLLELTRWCDGFPAHTTFAVRSSALAEDGAQHSFAGQFHTCLHVKPQDFEGAILDCWQSSCRASVQEYANINHIPLPLTMGVIIQQMVEADTAGVLFTANPQGLLNELVAVLGASTGDQVVEDKIPVTTLYHNRNDHLSYLESQPGAPDFPQDLTVRLTGAANTLEKLLGCPADAEFAIQNGTLFFLQVRPITTLDGANPTILDNSNLVESYPGLCLPLTASFAGEIYSGVFRGVARRCLPDEKAVARIEDRLQNMVSCVNGRMYYQISNWYSILRHFPFQSKVIPVWQRMMGVQNRQLRREDSRIPLPQRLRTYRNILRSICGIPRKMERLHKEFMAVNRYFNAAFSPDLSDLELTALYQEISRRLLDKWDITLLNDMYAFIFTAALEHLLRRKGVAAPQAEANRLISAGGDLASMRPVSALCGLALEASEDAILLAQLQALDSNAAVLTYLQENTPFAEKLGRYIEEFGDRSLEELKLESETFRTCPLLLVHTILDYAAHANSLALSRNAPPSAEYGFLISFCTRHARLGIENRECSRLDRCRIFGMVRRIFSAMAEHLAAEGYLACKQDSFYLTAEEFFSAAAPESAAIKDGFSALVERRKEEYTAFSVLPAYTRLEFAGKPFHKNPKGGRRSLAVQGAEQQRGTPCAGGCVRGRVRVVHTPAQARLCAGEILVTRMTDPGWVFLLAAAKGIISERGSILSHTAIIARELNVPFVADVPGVMDWLKTGDMVELNGETGEIQVISHV